MLNNNDLVSKLNVGFGMNCRYFTAEVENTSH